MRRLMLLSLLNSLASCATQVWMHADGDNSHFDRDSYVCERDAHMAHYGGGEFEPLLQQRLFERCMRAAGWHLQDRP